MAAQKEILEIKKIHQNPSRVLTYALGEREFNNIVALVRQTDSAAASVLTRGASNSSAQVARTGFKALKSVLPVAIGVGIFMTVFSANATAAPARAERDVINAVSNRTSLKREVLNAVNQNPANIGFVYSGGPQVKNMLQELFENESDNSLSAEKLLPYIEEWTERMHVLATDNNARQAYLDDIKRINSAAVTQNRQDFNERLRRDLTIPADNTRVERYIPVDLIRFKK